MSHFNSKKILDSANIFYEIRDDEFKYINRHKVGSIDENLSGCKGYVFFTKPELNLKNASSKTGFLNDIKHNDYDKIIKILSGGGPGSFINPLSNNCSNFNTSDDVLKTVETMKSFNGWSVMYAKNLDESKGQGTVSFKFKENKYLDMYYFHKIWCEYASCVYNGTISPSEYCIDNALIDYAVSIYYFLVDSDGKTIRFYSKLFGAFPTAVPNSAFAYDDGSSYDNLEINVPYQYTAKEDNNPIILLEFNEDSKGGGSVNGYDKSSGNDGSTWCSGIKVKWDSNGPYLEFYN